MKYTECCNNINTVNILKTTQLTFAIHMSLLVNVKIVKKDCCVNKAVWCFSTEGLINVGQDEILILLEYIEEELSVPKDIFYHITNIYNDAVKGTQYFYFLWMEIASKLILLQAIPLKKWGYLFIIPQAFLILKIMLVLFTSVPLFNVWKILLSPKSPF